MKLNKALLKSIGGIFLVMGILSGFLICSIMVWGDIEASIFTNGINGDKSFNSLNCPVIITNNETGTISAVIRNPSDKDSDRFLTAFISEGYATLVREIKTKIPIPANGKQKVEWKIYPEDAAYKRVVLFRVFVNAKYPYPSMAGNCGIVRIDFPWLNGNQFFLLMSIVTLSLLVTGSVMWEVGIQPAQPKIRRSSSALYFLVGTLVVTAIFSYIGLLLLGILGLAIAIILLGLLIFRC